MVDKALVLDRARSDIGKHQEGPNDKRNEFAKYIDETYPPQQWYNTRKNFATADWCTIFCDAEFLRTYGYDNARILLNAGSKTYGLLRARVREYYLALAEVEAITLNPEPGDLVFFGEMPYPRHVGIVEKVTTDTITTIEGNTNGGQVARHTYNYKSKSSGILGFGRPQWEKAGEDPAPDKYIKGETYKIVCKEYLNLRTGAGTNYAVAGRINPGNIVICDGCVTKKGYTWLRVNNFYICAVENGAVYIK